MKIESLNLEDYLPGDLIGIRELCECLRLRPEVGLMQFLGTVSGLLATGSLISLYEPTAFEEPMGVYFAVCTESRQWELGQRAIATEPLCVLQTQMSPRRVLFTNSATPAALRKRLNKKRRGVVVILAEMDFKNRHLFSYYDGMRKCEVLDSGEVITCDDVLISVLGAIRPKTLAEILHDKNPYGYWARLNIINQPIQKPLSPGIKLTPLLAGFYEKVANLDKLYLELSDDAENLMVRAMNQCEFRKVEAPTEGIAVQWSKLSAKIGRLAALIHITEKIMFGGNVNDRITAATLQKAITLGYFLVNEAISLYTEKPLT